MTRKKAPFFKPVISLGLAVLMPYASAASVFEDWTPDLDSVCGGYYAPPSLPENTADPEALEISANQSQLHLDGHTLLIGEVQLVQNDRQLSADSATIEHEPGTRNITSIEATGSVHFSQPGLQIIGEKASANRASGEMTVEDAEYRYYDRHARGTASKVRVARNHVSRFKDATYTTCAPEDNFWQLDASAVRLNPESGRGNAWNTWLKIKDIPVAYIPYISFPIDERRKTGFLYPSIGNAKRSGNFAILPFYWNLAPNYDALLSPKYLEKRGLGLDTDIRYLTHRSEGQLRLDTIFEDSVYEQFRHKKRRAHPTISSLSDPRLTGLHGYHRAFLSYQHKTAFNPYWSLDIDFNAVSDDNYFVDLDESLYGDTVPNLKQEFKLDYARGIWDASVRFQEFQVLHPFEGPAREELYRRQPQIQLAARHYSPVDYLSLDWDSEFVRFNVKRDPITQASKTHGDRWHFRPSITFPIHSTGWFIKPRVQWDVTYYELTRGTQAIALGKANQLSRHIPIYDLHAGITLDRSLTIGSHPYLQTLEPQAYYLYTPYRNQDQYPNFDSGPTAFSLTRLWRDNRFSSVDRVGDAHQLSLGLTSRFIDTKAFTERLRFSAGQALYFRDRKVSTCDQTVNPACRLLEDPNADDSLSPFVAEMGAYLTQQWYALGTYEFNHQIGEHERTSLSLEYRGDNNAVFNVGLQYLRADPARTNLELGQTFSLNQISASTFLPITPRWRFIARAFYDRAQHHLIDALAGVEYESCCFALQLVGSRFLRAGSEDIVNLPRSVTGIDPYDTAIYLQMTLKGLSAFGIHRNEKKLKTLIPGYRPYEERATYR